MQTARRHEAGAVGEAHAAVAFGPVADRGVNPSGHPGSALTDPQAVQWLRDRPDGQTELTMTELAAAWGWSRPTLARRIAAGLIARRPGQGRKSIFSLVSHVDATAGVDTDAAKSLDAAVSVGTETTGPSEATRTAPGAAIDSASRPEETSMFAAISEMGASAVVNSGVATPKGGTVGVNAEVTASSAATADMTAEATAASGATVDAISGATRPTPNTRAACEAAAPPTAASDQGGHPATGRVAMASEPGQIVPAGPTEGHPTHSARPKIQSSDILAGQAAPATSGTHIKAAMPLGLILAGLALALAWQGLQIDSWYGASLETTEAAGRISNYSMVADAVAFVLPAVARGLWCARRRRLALWAWMVWWIPLAVAINSTVGFLALNVSDTNAERVKLADGHAALVIRIGRLRAEQAAVTEFRPVKWLDGEINTAQPKVDKDVWRNTNHCTDVTMKASGEACAEVIRLRQALGSAQRREAMESELRDAEAQMGALPAITSADPQAEAMVALVSWVSRSRMTISQSDIVMTLLLALTLFQQTAGLLLMIALALLGDAIQKPFAWLAGLVQRVMPSLTQRDREQIS